MLRFLARAAGAASIFTAFAAAQAQEAAAPAAANPPAPAADTAPAQPMLTLEECVAQALGKNFSVRISRLPIDQAKDSVIIAQSTYDPVLGVQWQKSVVQSPTVTSSLSSGSGGSALHTNDQSTDATLSQNLPTGGSVGLDYNLARNASNNSFSVLNPAYDGDVSLNVSQPLLAGAGTGYALAEIKRAKLGVKIASLNFKSTVLATIFNIETAYFNLIFAREQYNVAQDAVKLAQQLYDENTEKRKTGVLTDLDVLQAQTGVATARSNLIKFDQTAKNNEDTLLQALGERVFATPVGPVAFPVLPDNINSVSFDYSYKLARENGPDLAVVQATIDQFKLDALRARQNRLPQLDLVGGGGYSSAEHSYTAAENRLWDGKGYNWNVGVNLSIPLGLRANRALYRQAMSNVSTQELTLDQADQNLMVQLRSAVRAVQTNISSVQAAAEAANLSQKQYDLQKAKFDAGLATSFDVLTAEDQLEQARVSELQSQADLHTAVADLRFLEGTSLEHYHVNLN